MAEYESLPPRLPPAARELLDALADVYPGYVLVTDLPQHLQDAAKWCIEDQEQRQRNWVSVCQVTCDPAALLSSAEDYGNRRRSGRGGERGARVDWVPCVPTAARLMLTPDGRNRLLQDRLWDEPASDQTAKSDNASGPERLTPEAEAIAPAAKKGEGTGVADSPPGQPATNPNVKSREILEGLQPADRKAYLSFAYAESKVGKRLEDHEAHEWLTENGIDTNKGDAGELADYSLPVFDTWSRQLRNARNPLGEQKYTRRAGRVAGRSIVKGDEIEYQRGDDG